MDKADPTRSITDSCPRQAKDSGLNSTGKLVVACHWSAVYSTEP